MADENTKPDVDVVVVGAGFAGLYLLHRLRELGFSARAFDVAAGVGGTWYWNRYPGARCDVQSIDYSYSFDADLQREWEWTEKYATQPEILRYLDHVADRFDLRRDITFETRVDHAKWDDDAAQWHLTTSAGESVSCRFYVMATGCLSAPKPPEIDGIDRYTGEVHLTSRWPHDGVDFTGKRVGVIGTGSSGIQSIPLIAEQVAELTVFQRTPNFTLPAHNGPVPAAKLEAFRTDPDGYRESARLSRAGIPSEVPELGALQVSDEERRESYEHVWERGELVAILGTYADTLIDPASNETLAEFVRDKIRGIVDDPATAEKLCPTSYPIGTKRPCLDTGYYATFNRPHVRLVDLNDDPIASITETGIDTAGESFTFDAIVFATGFDAMTGALVAVDIEGRDGVTLKDKWAEGPKTYLGLTTVGFPNFFAVTGPGSPSVLSNMAVSIEQHVEWITDCIDHMREHDFRAVEPTDAAEAGWVQHVNDFGDITLYPTADSWYMGANVPGKPRVFLPYVGGVDVYRTICDEVVADEYLGFSFRRDGESICHDGVVRRLAPDVGLMIEFIESLDLPEFDTLPMAEARELFDSIGAQQPPGPDVGEIVDSHLPGADGAPLDYRLYRPATPGPHPVVAYFHGGGWVFGSFVSDDAMCRDLCVRSDAVIVSVDYRHAPEHEFPAAVEDGFAAVQWLAVNAESIGGLPGQLAVAGWSAGGNVAAVAAQTARDAGGPELTGQLLLTPVTDSDFTRPSYLDNAEGCVLTRSLMEWFMRHYADPAEYTNPRLAPLRAADLSGLPPALVVTCEFDPLRDEGNAYAEALAAAGVDVRHVEARGQIHTSIPAVDLIVSGAEYRAIMADALRNFFGASVPA